MNRALLNQQHRERDRLYADQAEQRKWALFLIREVTDLRTDQIIDKYLPRMTLGPRSIPPLVRRLRR